MKQDLLESLAGYAHEAWSGWMKYLFEKSLTGSSGNSILPGSALIPKSLVNRWRRQMKTPYDELPENEKDSDRKEALRMLRIVEPYVAVWRVKPSVPTPIWAHQVVKIAFVVDTATERRVVEFIRREKINDLLADAGSLGALLRDIVESPGPRGKVKSRN
jgi:hypothetical protein